MSEDQSQPQHTTTKKIGKSPCAIETWPSGQKKLIDWIENIFMFISTIDLSGTKIHEQTSQSLHKQEKLSLVLNL